MAGISPAIFFLTVFLIPIAAAIKILREYERGVIFRPGRLIGAKSEIDSQHSYPGLQGIHFTLCMNRRV